MLYSPELRYSEGECHQLFVELFPDGLAGADVLAELAPEGWEKSPLVAVFHPSPERLHEEAVCIHENLQGLIEARAAKGKDPAAESSTRRPPPTLDEIRADQPARPVEPERELRELVGMCLWDIFSDNHEVIGPDGRIVDLGSFRASAGFLAELINRELGFDPGRAEKQEMERLRRLVDLKSLEALMEEVTKPPEEEQVYDYMNFYMGTQTVAGRADLSPLYRLIFQRLKTHDCDWQYHFPRLLLVDMRPLRDSLKEQEDKPEWGGYDPSVALAEDQEEQDRTAELEKMRTEMAESHQEAVETARDGPSPMTVASYQAVYEELPSGWPPEVED